MKDGASGRPLGKGRFRTVDLEALEKSLTSLEKKLRAHGFPSPARAGAGVEKYTNSGHRIFWNINKQLSRGVLGIGAGALNDKLIFSGFARAAGFRTADILGVCTRETFFRPADRMVLQVPEGLSQLEGRVFAKARSGRRGGKGCFIIEAANGRLTMEGTPSTASEVARRLRSFGAQGAILERCITPHAEMKRLYPNSVNTLRVLTSTLDGPARVVAITQRMGRGSRVVDNSLAGGIYAGVDLESGELVGPAVSKKKDRYAVHPDTGVAIEGFRPPHLAAVMGECVTLHQVYGHLPTVGWDIAVGPDGPLIVEGNTYWSAGLHRAFDPTFLYHLALDLDRSDYLTSAG